MIRYILLIVFAILFINLQAQMQMVEKVIEVGMVVKIGSCANGKKAFESMDQYVKTRYPANDIKRDSITGEGIFEWFFTTGDFDAKRLPCDYSNMLLKVAALRELPDKEHPDEMRRVMFLYGKSPLELIWVEFDKAMELKEISW
jgi:hypothetical protein